MDRIFIILILEDMTLVSMNQSSVTFKYKNGDTPLLISRSLFNRLLKKGGVEGTFCTLEAVDGKYYNWFFGLSMF